MTKSGVLLQRRFLLTVWILAACGCCPLAGGSTSGDVTSINQTTNCVSGVEGIPSGLNVSVITNSSATIHWNPVTPPNDNVLGYQVIYWPISSTSYQGKTVTGFGSDETTVTDLQPYTTYSVVVRLYCSPETVGPASSIMRFTTEAAAPTGKVSNLLVTLNEGGEQEANVSWIPLLPGQWNGVPFGYYVYVFRYSTESMCGGDPSSYYRTNTYRNSTSIIIPLTTDACYRIAVFPVNHKAWGPASDPLYFSFTRRSRVLTILSEDEVPQPTSPPPTPFLNSPYVYILVLVIVAVVPVVFGIVLLKKSREKKRKVQYVRGIQSGDMPMYPLSPMSGNSSAHISPNPGNSRIQAFSPLSNPSPMTPSRPLLAASPMPPHCDHPPLPPNNNHFAMPMPFHTAQTHSPTSPGMMSGGDAEFMSRNFNTMIPETGDVFMGSGARPHVPSDASSHNRPRAYTESGANMPNPYEHPIHPGGASTLPRGSSQIPPPPKHAPPPLTKSSMEIFSRASHSPLEINSNGRSGSVGQHPTHRGMSQRSFSTTNAAGNLASPTSTVPPGGDGPMRVIRSASMLHPVNEKDIDGPDYATVEPPGFVPPPRKASTLDRYPPPAHHQHYPNGNGRNSDELSSFSEMTADNDSVQLSSHGGGGVPGSFRHTEMGVYRPPPGGDQRESVFSETSTEQSISSGSIREASPSGAPSWVSGSEKRRNSSSSATPTNSRTSQNQLHYPRTSPP